VVKMRADIVAVSKDSAGPSFARALDGRPTTGLPVASREAAARAGLYCVERPC